MSFFYCIATLLEFAGVHYFTKVGSGEVSMLTDDEWEDLVETVEHAGTVRTVRDSSPIQNRLTLSSTTCSNRKRNSMICPIYNVRARFRKKYLHEAMMMVMVNGDELIIILFFFFAWSRIRQYYFRPHRLIFQLWSEQLRLSRRVQKNGNKFGCAFWATTSFVDNVNVKPPKKVCPPNDSILFIVKLIQYDFCRWE